MGKRAVRKVEYDAYLASADWRAVRNAFYAKNRRACARCSSTSRLQLHHTTYKHIFQERHHLEDLICLCYQCHAVEHELPAVSRKSYWKSKNTGKRRRRKLKPQPPREKAGVDQAAAALARWAAADGVAND